MKARTQEPNSWHVLVTLFAMFYLAAFTSDLVLASFISSNFVRGVLILDLLIAFAWCFLILDLAKQISLFFRKKNK